MMLSPSPVPGASDLGADGLVLYKWYDLGPRPEIATPDGYEPVGPLVIVWFNEPGSEYLWARAFAPTSEEQVRRDKAAQAEQERDRRKRELAAEDYANKQLDGLWAANVNRTKRPPLSKLTMTELRILCHAIGATASSRRDAEHTLRTWAARGGP